MKNDPSGSWDESPCITDRTLQVRLLVISGIDFRARAGQSFGDHPVEGLLFLMRGEFAELFGERFREEDVIGIRQEIVMAGNVSNRPKPNTDAIPGAQKIVNVLGRQLCDDLGPTTLSPTSSLKRSLGWRGIKGESQ